MAVHIGTWGPKATKLHKHNFLLGWFRLTHSPKSYPMLLFHRNTVNLVFHFFLQFVAHRHVQLLLADIVYGNCPLARYFLQGLFLYAVYTLTFPLWALVFIFCRECKISKYMATPFGKFSSHTSQFCVFIMLLIISSFRDSHEPSVIG